MAGVFAKTQGVWVKAAQGPSGIGTFSWTKRAGVWVLSAGGTTLAASWYIKRAGAWVPERQAP